MACDQTTSTRLEIQYQSFISSPVVFPPYCSVMALSLLNGPRNVLISNIKGVSSASLPIISRPLSSFRSTSLPLSSSRHTIPTTPYNTFSRSSSYSSSAIKSSSNLRRNLALGSLTIGTLLLGSYFYLQSGERTEDQLSNGHFIPLKVLRIESLTKDTMKFTLALPDELLPAVEEVSLVPIRSVYIMQPDINVQRAYTALNADSFVRGKTGELDLVIKRYPDGEVSRWMHRLRVGDEVKVRGPAVTWFQREEYDEVDFIVGGTGITPAYQFILHTLSSSTPKPKINVVYASSSPSDILLKSELDTIAKENPDVVSIHYLVSKPDTGMKALPKGSESTLGRFNKKDLEKWIGRGIGEKSKMVLVSGPEGMVEFVAGPRGRNQSSGPVGGLLKELGYTEKQVVKL